jgi:hypothetical protein
VERLTFERQVRELQTRQDKPVYRIDFYDQIDPHLRYLGQLVADAPRAHWQIRLVIPANLKQIFDANRKIVMPLNLKNFGVTLPGRALEDTLYPETVGFHYAQPRFDYAKIAQQIRAADQSLLVRVPAYADQKKKLDGLLSAAKRDNKEKGMYIVIEPKHAEGVADLDFIGATPLASSNRDFTFPLGVQRVRAKKIITVSSEPSDKRQVIGTVHTHFLHSTGTQRIVHEVSALDVQSAKDNQFVVYAIEDKEWHKATPAGKALNRLKPQFNLLVDALETLAGKHPPISGAI